MAGTGTYEETSNLVLYVEKCRNLTVFTHRKGCNNEILEAVGRCCPRLQVNTTGLPSKEKTNFLTLQK